MKVEAKFSLSDMMNKTKNNNEITKLARLIIPNKLSFDLK